MSGREQPALPNPLPRPVDELTRLEHAWQPGRGWRLLSSVNNQHVGLWYLGTALGFLLLAGVLAVLMRLQLALPDNTLISAHTYNQLFTMHGTVMMFLFAVPVVEAAAVFLLPAMLGARDLPFPRLSAYAYWAYAFGGVAFFITLFFDAAPDGGWFMYPPLTSKAYSPGLGADFWLLGIGFIEISAIAGAIELIIGILFTRAPGMTLARMPVFAWAMLVSALMIVFAFPAIIAGTALLELERAFDWPFFIAERGGDPLLWQHLFWFFGHPEVSIIFLPAAGLVSMMVPVVAQTPLVARRWVVGALGGVGVISFALWAHHMFTAGLGVLPISIVSAASMAVAVPSAIQVFAWIATLWRGSVRPWVSTWFIVGFLFLFVLGGLTGVMLATVPFDWQAHDTHFVVAHLHYVLIGGMVFPLIGALYHWFPLVNGHRLSERCGRWVFVLMFGGFNLAFFPMHVVGLLGMPRRVATYAAESGWMGWNLASTLGAVVLALGFLLLLIDVVRTLRCPERAHGDPWHGATLEWVPMGNYGARSVPDVQAHEPAGPPQGRIPQGEARRLPDAPAGPPQGRVPQGEARRLSDAPLWARPSYAHEVPTGRHWLPGTVTGGRETLLTSAREAKLLRVLPLPGDSWLPVVAALGTAGFFLLLTVNAVALSFVCFAIGVVAAWCWLWQLDRAPALSSAPVGTGVWLPVGAQGTRSHAWWATWVLVVVHGSIFASMVYAHVHVSLQATVCPPPGAQWPATGNGAVVALLLAAGSIAIERALRAVQRSNASRPIVGWVAVATLCTVGAFALDAWAHGQAGLRPTAQAWSATVAALLGWQGLHAVLIAFLGVFVIARARAGLVLPRCHAGLQCAALLWHYTTLQGAVLAVGLPLLPRWLA